MPYALITGGSKGIGKEIAFELAKRKSDILLVARSEEELKTTAEEIKAKYSVKVEFLALDLIKPDACKELLSWCTQNQFTINTLVNNAGYAVWGYFEKLDIQAQKDMMQLNMTTLVELTHLFIPMLKTQSKSYILNVSSTTAYQAIPTLSVYAATKAFVLLFSRGLRFELQNTPISVTCLSPGATTSNFTNRAGMQAMQAMAEKFNMDPKVVAQMGVNAMLKEKAEIITGLVNVVSARAANFLPKSIIEKIAANLYLKYLK